MAQPDDPGLAGDIRALARQGFFNRADTEPVRVLEASPLGRGESYAAWLLQRPDAEPLVLRLARRPLSEMPRPMAQEFAALQIVPDGVGTRGLAMCDDAANPLEVPERRSSTPPLS